MIDAMQAANSQGGGTISLAPDCTYTLTDGPFDAGDEAVGLPIVESAITINGNHATIQRAAGSQVPPFRLFQVSKDPAGVLTIDGAVLRGGTVESHVGAGAILVRGPGALTITDSVVTHNNAGPGGAISGIQGSKIRISGSVLFDNHASVPDTPGGAITNSNGLLVVNNSVIAGNVANGEGGGIWAPAGITKVTNTTMTNNTARNGQDGGAISSGGVRDPSQLTVDRSTFSSNKATGGLAPRGGAIANKNNSTLTVTDSTVSGNSAGTADTPEAVGGGIFSSDTASVTTTTLAGNRALGDEALGNAIAASRPLTVTASIVSASERSCAGQVADGGFNLENGKTCHFTDHAVRADPQIKSLADNGGVTQTRALRPTSPALNKVPPGRPYCGGTVDQRGVKRPQGKACDIGSFELKLPR